MTPEQVNALSNEELNRAMIWLYPPSKSQFRNSFYWSLDVTDISDDGEMVSSGSYEDTVYLDYLEDYNLTMPLVIENQILIGPMNDPVWPNFWKARNNKAVGIVRFNKNPLRAACECLVLVALESKK